MEFYRDINEQHDYFLEELLGLRSETNYSNCFTAADQQDLLSAINGGFWTNTNCNRSPTLDVDSSYNFPLPADYYPSNLNFLDDFSLPFTTSDHHLPLPYNCSPYALFGDDQISQLDFALDSPPSQTRPPLHACHYSLPDDNGFRNSDPDPGPPCKLETLPGLNPSFQIGSFCSSNSRKERGKKKVNGSGQPSKNLMAERRRRKRLNDRLSMLRSIVPKISKMDRTSIVGDTIDYIKELLERISTLQQQHMQLGSSANPQLTTLMSIFQEPKPNELLLRNSPKFDVERRNVETRVEICCGGKPGLLQSTVTTLEALGLDIQQCVISCFNDFALQASCSEELKKRSILDTEDIKQALVRNAGYGTAN